MAIDNSAFFFSFNAFDQTSYLDPFEFTNQMNYYLGNGTPISESVETEQRLKFNEVFEVVPKSFSSYPPPLVYRHDRGSRYQYVHYYAFREEDTAWVWREAVWKDVDRDVPEEGNRLYFMSIVKPQYYFDNYKQEHRLIIEEGTYTIQCIAPEIEDRTLLKNPSISIDGNHKRYFNILYDDYDSITQVTWADETPEGAVDGSGASTGTESAESIYEITAGDGWLGIINVLYDAEATTEKEVAEAAGRIIIMNYDELTGDFDEVYYNRGVQATIPISGLTALPFEIAKQEIYESTSSLIINELLGTERSSVGFAGVMAKGNTTATFDGTLFEDGAVGTGGECLSTIIVRGFWGVRIVKEDSTNSKGQPVKLKRYYRFSRPGVTVTITNVDESSEEFVLSTAISAVDVFPANVEDVDDYEIIRELRITPKRMISENIKSIAVVLTPAEDGEYIATDGRFEAGVPSIIKIEFGFARYTSQDETIKVWEQKYFRSTSDNITGVNLNGPSKIITMNQDMDWSGQYYPGRGSASSFSGRSKIRQAVGTEEFPNTVEIEGITTSTLAAKEKEEQQKLYVKAISLDTYENCVFSIVIPPEIKEFLADIGAVLTNPGISEFNVQILPWKNLFLVSLFEEGAMWYPGGHKFIWSDKYHQERCLMRDVGRAVADGLFKHIGHAGEFEEEVLDPYRALYWLQGSYLASKQITNIPRQAGAGAAGLNVSTYG